MRRKNKNKSYLATTDKQAPAEKQPTNVDVKKVESDFLSVLRLQTKQRNGLLGNFSSDGKYKISDENILKELLNIPKKFQEKQDNVVYASSKLAEFVLNFKVVFDISESFCKANIFLIEIESDVEEDIKHLTLLDSVEEIYSPKFKDEVFKKWNIFVDEEINVKNDFLYEYLKTQNEELLFRKELVEILSQLYLVRMLKILENAGETGQKVLLQYKQLVEKFFNKDVSITQDNTRLMQILNSVIIKNKAFEKILELPEGSAVLLGYSTPILRISDKTRVLEAEVKKSEQSKDNVSKKVDAPKKSKSKGGGEDSGKGYAFNWKDVKPFNVSGVSFTKPAQTAKPLESTIKNQDISKPATIKTEEDDEKEPVKSEKDILANFANAIPDLPESAQMNSSTTKQENIKMGDDLKSAGVSALNVKANKELNSSENIQEGKDANVFNVDVVRGTQELNSEDKNLDQNKINLNKNKEDKTMKFGL